MFCKELILVSDKLWVVKRKIRISDNPVVNNWKLHLKSDIVFKKEPYFYFCEEVIDVDVI